MIRRCFWLLATSSVLRVRAIKKKPASTMSPVGKAQLDTTKAGLLNVDKAHVNTVIAESSKGSAFYKNELRMERERKQRCRALAAKAKKYRTLSAGDKRAVSQRVSVCEEELEAHRHFGNYVHVDMDMFYAAVEMKKNPSLASVPLGVGGASMLSTTNYVARQYGVRSGMPGFIGRKLCPALVIVPPDFASYRAEAAAVRGIAAEYDAHFASVGLDELTMELSAHLRRRGGTAAEVAAEFRARVLAATGLTASAGIAPTATLAKIASNYNKPNGQHELRLRNREEVVRFVRDLHVRTVPGIGKSTESVLHGIGVTKLGDIIDRRVELFFLITEKTFRFLLGAALGVIGMFDASQTEEERGTEADRKSIGQEVTFHDIHTREGLQKIAFSNLETVHETLTEEALVCGQVVLKIKWTSFRTQQFTKNLLQYTDELEVLRRALDELLLPHLDQSSLMRLLGVRVTRIITREELATQQRQTGVQRSLMDYSLRRSVRDEDSGVEVLISSPSSLSVSDGESDDVLCVSPPQKRAREGETTPVIDRSIVKVEDDDDGVIIVD